MIVRWDFRKMSSTEKVVDNIPPDSPWPLPPTGPVLAGDRQKCRREIIQYWTAALVCKIAGNLRGGRHPGVVC